MKSLSALFVLLPSLAFAGGSLGGGSPGIMVMELPKAYIDGDAFRRASIRLGESGVELVGIAVDGELIQVRKLQDSIVDVAISKEILPQ